MGSEKKEKVPDFVQVWLKVQEEKQKREPESFIDYLGNEDDNRDDDDDACYCE